MNIEFANTIPLTQILSKIELQPVTEKDQCLGYYSPLSAKPKLSLFVNTKRNDWFDYALGKGGTTVEFVCAYLAAQEENHQTRDALRWLNNMAGYIPTIPDKYLVECPGNDSGYIVRSNTPLYLNYLVQYLKDRGISIPLAQKHFRQIRLYNKETEQGYFALGLKNEVGGFSAYCKKRKLFLGPKNITFIRGNIPKPDGVHIFKDIFDYLSYLTHLDIKSLDDDSIILNCYTCLPKSIAYIKNYGYRTVYTWMDNDMVGDIATEELATFFQTEENLSHQKQNEKYAPHKDIASWHLHRCGLLDEGFLVATE
jgi:hypothetical protein